MFITLVSPALGLVDIIPTLNVDLVSVVDDTRGNESVLFTNPPIASCATIYHLDIIYS